MSCIDWLDQDFFGEEDDLDIHCVGTGRYMFKSRCVHIYI